MIKKLQNIIKQIRISILVFLPGAYVLAQPTAQTFSYSGSVQTFTVPACVLSLSIEAEGAQGNYNTAFTVPGGLGGRVSGVLTVTPGQVLSIFVGGTNGYNGGGNPGYSPCTGAMGGSGGGASDIRINGINLNNRIVIAGGGGGAGGNRVSGCGRGAGGGGGGGYYGGGGGSGFPQTSTIVPTGGSQFAGGNGGVSAFTITQNGAAGSLGHGGNGGGEISTVQNSSSSGIQGGHGGGLIGFNGQQPQTNMFTGQSGAGGSSYAGGMSNVVMTAGTRQGNGRVTIYYNTIAPVNIIASNTLICANSTVTLSTSSLQSYAWSDSSTTQNIVVTPTVSSIYSVSGINAMGCSVAGSVAVTVHTNVPSLLISNSAPTVCPNHPVILIAHGASTYSWSNNIVNSVPFTPTASGTYTVTGSNVCGTSTAVTSVSITPLQLTASALPTHVCAGSTVTLSVNGASTYSWFPNTYFPYGTFNFIVGSNLVVTPTASITYTILGRTNTCSGATSFVLNVDPVPAISIASTSSMICLGDTVNMNVSGVQSYTWINGGPANSSISVSPTVSTLYSVIGTNSFNCQSMQSQVVLVNALPILNLTASDPTVCAGGSSTLSASGANTYSWNGVAGSSVSVVNPVGAGVYNLTGVDNNGCRSTASVSISIFSPTVAVSSSTAICLGDAVMLGATGADSYTWSTGQAMPYVEVSPTISTVYTLSAIVSNDDGLSCSASNTVAIQVNALPQVTVTNAPDVICRGEAILLNASGALTYTWNSGSIHNLTTSYVHATPVCNQTYTLTGVDANGCENTGIIHLKVAACTGISTVEASQKLSVYPNPSNGEFTIGTQQYTTIEITDQVGRQVRSIALNPGDQELKVNDLENGVYVITAKNEQGSVKQKVIVAK